MISSERLVRELGLKSVQLVWRWAAMGLIPKPVTRTHPNGKGKMGFYGDEVIVRCKEIIKLRQEGFSYPSIVAHFHRENLTAPLSVVRKITNRHGNDDLMILCDVNEQFDFYPNDLMIAAIIKHLAPAFQAASLKEMFIDSCKKDDIFSKAMDLLREGFNPVIIWDGQTARITADVMIVKEIAEKQENILVMPLKKPLDEFAASLGAEIVIQPNLIPVISVAKKKGKKTVKFDVSEVNGKIELRAMRRSR